MMKKPHFEINETSHINNDLEIALIKIARAIYEYIGATSSSNQLMKIKGLIRAFQLAANDYHNKTESFHPDIGLELAELADFKEIYLTVSLDQQAENARAGKGSSGIDEKLINQTSKEVLALIETIEQKLDS